MKWRTVLAVAVLPVSLAACQAQSQAPATAPAMKIVAPQTSPPAEVAIDGVTADVSPIDAPDGILKPPDDISALGWWSGSSMPGDAGTTVITGHIDMNGVDGFGKRFSQLKAGDPVVVTLKDGGTHYYTITEVDNYNKQSDFPATQLNSLSGTPVLALVTCGGKFIGPPNGYQDNVIAWAQ